MPPRWGLKRLADSLTHSLRCGLQIYRQLLLARQSCRIVETPGHGSSHALLHVFTQEYVFRAVKALEEFCSRLVYYPQQSSVFRLCPLAWVAVFIRAFEYVLQDFRFAFP